MEVEERERERERERVGKNEIEFATLRYNLTVPSWFFFFFSLHSRMLG